MSLAGEPLLGLDPLHPGAGIRLRAAASAATEA
jgi:hypothetical protein